MFDTSLLNVNSVSQHASWLGTNIISRHIPYGHPGWGAIVKTKSTNSGQGGSGSSGLPGLGRTWYQDSLSGGGQGKGSA